MTDEFFSRLVTDLESSATAPAAATSAPPNVQESAPQELRLPQLPPAPAVHPPQAATQIAVIAAAVTATAAAVAVLAAVIAVYLSR